MSGLRPRQPRKIPATASAPRGFSFSGGGELLSVAVELSPRRDQLGAVFADRPLSRFAEVVDIVPIDGLAGEDGDVLGNLRRADEQVAGEALVPFIVLVGVHRESSMAVRNGLKCFECFCIIRKFAAPK